jgi:L-seryl-tRNA(Ser) seleniumtransferase
MADNILRKLPAVDALFGRDEARALIKRFGREQTLAAVRAALDETRAAILAMPNDAFVTPEHILGLAAARLDYKSARTLRRAINATGILMHSGLGRALLSEDARQALDEVVRGYSTLALDIDSGLRGQRDAHVASLLRELTGAEAATICNNNAAATVLVLNTIARGREVILSRSQLVEIGGSFRMPDVMAMSGAVLREVGTTNKTHLRDYAEAIGPNTGAILRVHHSNYRILGFHAEPSIEELAALGRERGILVIDDIGSGALVDLKRYGLETEPLVRASVAAGVACACFSGDKLIGGPQSGIIVGKGDAIARIKKNPLARALRCGKLTLAAMEATLRLFLAPDKLEERHPIYRMLARNADELERRGRAIVEHLKTSLPAGVGLSVEDGEAQIGSGSVPVETIPSKVVALKTGAAPLEELARKLRRQSPAVFTRIHKDALLFDLRTIQPDEDADIERAIHALFA